MKVINGMMDKILFPNLFRMSKKRTMKNFYTILEEIMEDEHDKSEYEKIGKLCAKKTLNIDFKFRQLNWIVMEIVFTVYFAVALLNEVMSITFISLIAMIIAMANLCYISMGIMKNTRDIEEMEL